MKSTQPLLIITSALLAVAIAGFPLVSRLLPKPVPVHLAEADYSPSEVSNSGAFWYWIERAPKAKEKLLKASAAGKEMIAQADEIAGYSVEGDTVAWAARDGNTWRVSKRSAGTVETVSEGADRIGRPVVSGGKVIWPVVQPGIESTSTPLPALGPTVEIHLPGGTSETKVRLMESRCDLVGVKGDSGYAICARPDAGQQTAIYEFSLTNGTSRRIGGEGGESVALLSGSGGIVWTGPSRDSSLRKQLNSIRHIDSGGKVITSVDWLPSAGRLFESGSRLYYIGGTPVNLWQVSHDNELPRQQDVPDGFSPVAAGASGLLLQSSAYGSQRVSLYTISLS